MSDKTLKYFDSTVILVWLYSNSEGEVPVRQSACDTLPGAGHVEIAETES